MINGANLFDMSRHHTVDNDQQEVVFNFAAFKSLSSSSDSEGEPAKPTCQTMMTTLRFRGNKDIAFDCDTGSSHNVMSIQSFKEIWPDVREGPKLFPKQGNITLADGSTSKAPMGSMRCVFVAPNGQRFKQHFYVIKGPHNLLGRYGMKCIWPKEYGAMAAAAEAPFIRKPTEFQLRSAQSADSAATVHPRTDQARVPDLPQQRTQSPQRLMVPDEFIKVEPEDMNNNSTAVRQSVQGSGKRVIFAEGESVRVYDFKSKLSDIGIIKKVLGANTYSVDCGEGYLRHVSGDALSKVRVVAQEVGSPELTAQQEDLGDQDEPDVVVEPDSDSSDDEEDYGHSIVVPAVLPRRRRGRLLTNQGLGPVQATRLRPRN